MTSDLSSPVGHIAIVKTEQELVSPVVLMPCPLNSFLDKKQSAKQS